MRGTLRISILTTDPMNGRESPRLIYSQPMPDEETAQRMLDAWREANPILADIVVVACFAPAIMHLD